MGLIRWIVLIGIFACPFRNLIAQTSDWAVVAHLSPGQKIKIETTNAKTETGKVKSASDDSIDLGKNRLFQRQDVQRVWLQGGNHRGRNALIGLGAGAALGFATSMTCTGKGFDWGKGACAAVSIPFLGAMGAGIGALVPSRSSWQEIYQSRSERQP